MWIRYQPFISLIRRKGGTVTSTLHNKTFRVILFHNHFHSPFHYFLPHNSLHSPLQWDIIHHLSLFFPIPCSRKESRFIDVKTQSNNLLRPIKREFHTITMMSI